MIVFYQTHNTGDNLLVELDFFENVHLLESVNRKASLLKFLYTNKQLIDLSITIPEDELWKIQTVEELDMFGINHVNALPGSQGG